MKNDKKMQENVFNEKMIKNDKNDKKMLKNDKKMIKNITWPTFGHVRTCENTLGINWINM